MRTTRRRFTDWPIALLTTASCFVSCVGTPDIDPGPVTLRPNPPTLSMSSPRSSSAYDPEPTFEIEGVPQLGGRVQFFAGTDCATLISEGGFEPSLHGPITAYASVKLKKAGSYGFSAKVFSDQFGTWSDCSTETVTYRFMRPPVPSSLNLAPGFASPGHDPRPRVLVSGTEEGVTTRLYSDSTCSTEIGSNKADHSTVQIDVTTPFSSGQHSIYARSFAGTESSACSSASLSYEVLPPPVPATLALYSPASSPNTVPRVTVQVSGVAKGIDVLLYKDADCTMPAGSSTASSSIAYVTSESLGFGSHTLYAKTRTGNDESACSASGVWYEVIPLAGPSDIQLVEPDSAPSYYNTPLFEISSVSSGDTVTLYSGAACETEIGSASANGATVQVRASALEPATHEIRAVISRGSGARSLCSSVSAEYEVVHRLSFAPAVTYDAGSGAQHLETGRLDGDAHLDLVAHQTSYLSGRTTVFLGSGDGSFDSGTSLGNQNSYLGHAMGDVNGDGIPDLLHTDSQGGKAVVRVRLGNGDGTFGSPTQFETGDQAGGYFLGGMTAADFDGDGNLDVAAYHDGSPDAYVSLHLGNGDGTFQTEARYSAVRNCSQLRAAELSGDGRIDLVSTCPNTVAILLNDGAGGLDAAQSYDSGPAYYSSFPAIADFDEDGAFDIAVANQFQDRFSVLLNQGDGTFAERVTYGYTTPGSYDEVTAGDFDGDGHLDIAVGNSANRTISVFFGNGDGSFDLDLSFALPDHGRITAMLAADLDGDGNLDIAAATLSGIRILLNEGAP